MAAARFTVSLFDRDRGWEALAKRLKASAGRTIAKVGLLGQKNERSDGGPTNAEIALVHEFGSPEHDIPQRSFIRPAFDQQLRANTVLLAGFAKDFLDGKMSIGRAVGLIGTKMAADIKRFVTAGSQVPPPNAPSVFARKLAKGSDPRTLVDTGQMVGAITHVVKGGDSGD